MAKKTYVGRDDMIIERGFFRGEPKKKTVSTADQKKKKNETTKKK